MQKHFLLIQEGEVVDSATTPEKLAFNFIDDSISFNVAIGCINEFGKPEVVGIIAGAFPVTDAATWRITSLIDGSDRRVGAIDHIYDLLRARLITYNNMGHYNDLVQLPEPIVIWGAK